MCSTWEIVRIVDRGPYVGADERTEPFRFRLEISKAIESTTHRVTVYRRETYRLTPTYPINEEGEPEQLMSDAEVWVRDDSRDWSIYTDDDADALLATLIDVLDHIFGQA